MTLGSLLNISHTAVRSGAARHVSPVSPHDERQVGPIDSQRITGETGHVL
jgi:hypothetical protein